MYYADRLEGTGPRRTVTAICKRLAGELKDLRDTYGKVEMEGAQDFDDFVEVLGPGAVVLDNTEPPVERLS